MFLVKKEEECSYFSLSLLLSLKYMAWKHITYLIINSDPGHTCLKQQSEKSMKITSISPPINTNAKEKEKDDGYCKAFCVTHKRNTYIWWKLIEINIPDHISSKYYQIFNFHLGQNIVDKFWNCEMFKGCVCYTFATLFFKSKQKCFL